MQAIIATREKRTVTGEFRWVVCDQGGEIYVPKQSGDSGLKACKSWLINKGYVCQGTMPPECFEYVRCTQRMLHQTQGT